MLDQMEDAADQRAGLPVPGPAETAMARSFADRFPLRLV